MGTKHIPLRTCIICRTTRPKRELVRVVGNDPRVAIDPTGKQNGRGAYVCRQQNCWMPALENPARLASALKLSHALAPDDLAVLRAETSKFPQQIETSTDAPPRAK